MISNKKLELLIPFLDDFNIQSRLCEQLSGNGIRWSWINVWSENSDAIDIGGEPMSSYEIKALELNCIQYKYIGRLVPDKKIDLTEKIVEFLKNNQYQFSFVEESRITDSSTNENS